MVGQSPPWTSRQTAGEQGLGQQEPLHLPPGEKGQAGSGEMSSRAKHALRHRLTAESGAKLHPAALWLCNLSFAVTL